MTALRRDEPSWGSGFPFDVPAVAAVGDLALDAPVTLLAGDNGTGKSTLVEAFAESFGFEAEGGELERLSDPPRQAVPRPVFGLEPVLSRWARPRTGYFLRAESFFNVASYMDGTGYLDSYGGKSLHSQSHGESFMAVLLNKLRGNGIYLLDEPEAALSPNRQLAALSAIHQLVEDHSQFIIATHSPILLSYPHAKIFLLDKTGVTEVAYEDTEHYAVTRDFLNHYPRRLEQLLQDEPDL